MHLAPLHPSMFTNPFHQALVKALIEIAATSNPGNIITDIKQLFDRYKQHCSNPNVSACYNTFLHLVVDPRLAYMKPACTALVRQLIYCHTAQQLINFGINDIDTCRFVADHHYRLDLANQIDQLHQLTKECI